MSPCLEGDKKKDAAKKKAEALKLRAAAEALQKAKYDAGLTLGNIRKSKVAKWPTVCGEQECMTCARQVENTGLMMLKCGTKDSVIAQVNFAMWGVAADQADWVLSTKAGMCGHPMFGLSNLTNATTVEEQNAAAFNFKGVRKVRARDTLRVVQERCVGLHECNLMPIRQLMGQARGGEAEVHALSVAINCSSGTDFLESMTSTLIETYGLKCTPPLGCPTCMKSNRTKDGPTRLECYGDAIIADINDAVYGAEEQQPDFFFDPTAASCNLTAGDRTIPTGNMCRNSRSRAIRAVKRRCLGRQNCAFSQTDMEEMFPKDPCPGQAKRLTIIGTCMKSQLPLDVESFMEDSEFGFVQLESRRFSYTTPALSQRDAYQMRVTFQSAPSAYQSRYLNTSAPTVWGVESRKGGSTRRVHRLMATMSLPDYMGSDGANYFTFRVRGRKFWDKGGVLSVVQKSNERDFCGAEGKGCDLKGCVPAKGEPADTCTFEVRLPGEAQYQVFLYGITADEDVGSAVWLEWKPPSTCKLYADSCLDALNPDSCLKLSRDDMPWQPMKPGKFPWINCRTAFAAEVLSMTAELKPYCMDTDGFDGVLRDCWPAVAAPGKDAHGAGCEGTYDATSGFSDTVMFAVKVRRCRLNQ